MRQDDFGERDFFAAQMGDDVRRIERGHLEEEAVVGGTSPAQEADPGTAAPGKKANPVVIGYTAGVARIQADRLRRGDLRIEARLDLHGRKLREAPSRVANFLGRCATRGQRCVLIITGKGRGGVGVIREGLQSWLNHPDVRPLVLACVPARPRDGGDGAFYVLLRRTR